MPLMGTKTRSPRALSFTGLLVLLGTGAATGGLQAQPWPPAVAPMQMAAPPAIGAADGTARRADASWAVEQLGEMADAVRGRIAGLPGGACSLSVEWPRYTDLVEAVLSRLTEESDSREFGHAHLVLGQVDMFVTMAESLTAEVCADWEAVGAAQRSVHHHLEQAGPHFTRLVRAIRGDKFPFPTLDDFLRFYRGTKWYEIASRLELPRALWASYLVTSPEEIYSLVRDNTSVANGQVRVTMPRGPWKVSAHFDRWWANELTYRVRESLPNGLTLYTGWIHKNCSGKSSALSCYPGLRKLGSGEHRLSTALGTQMYWALGPAVMIACKSTVVNQEALRDLVLEHRPHDAHVRQAYDGIADRLVHDIGLVARSGAEELCGPSRFLEDQLDVAKAAWHRELGPDTTEIEVYEKFRARLQRQLDIAGYRTLEAYTPPFRAGDVVASDHVGFERDAAEANDAYEKAVGPVTALSRAMNAELPPLVRARAAARAARGFAAVVEANLAGRDTSEAIGARLSALDFARSARSHADEAVVAAEGHRLGASAAAASRAVRAALAVKGMAEHDYWD